jgi:predicted  nucleic acid-binding Zn-ribbon protein
LTIKDLDKGEKQMAQELLKYQTIDANLKKIETELSGSEERKKAVSAKKYIDGVEDNVNKLDDRAKELISAFDVIRATEEKYKEQQAEFVKALEQVADETEAQYLIKKIEELLNKIKSLNAESAKLTAEIQGLLKDYASIKSTTKAAQAQYAEYGKKYNELKASKAEEMKKIELELAELKKEVDPAVMEKYLKKRTDKIFPILYEATPHGCGYCNMEISMSAQSKLKNGEIIECDQCGRLLYKA